MATLLGKSIKAFNDQNHEAHIAVHLQFMNDPSLAGNPAAQGTIGPVLIAHVAEHVALLYRLKMEEAMNIQLPELPDLRDPHFRFDDVPPELDNAIAERAAQVVQQAPTMTPIPGLSGIGGQQGQSQDPLEYAKQLAQLEAESLKARTEAQIQSDQAKAQSDIAIEQAKAQQQLQVQMAKMQADIDAKIAKLQAEVQIAQQKAASDAQRDETKAIAAMQHDEVKAQSEIQREEIKAQSEMQRDEAKADFDMQVERAKVASDIQKESIKPTNEGEIV